MGALEVAVLLGALYALLFLPPLYFQHRLRQRDVEDEDAGPAMGGRPGGESPPDRSLPESASPADVVVCEHCETPNDARFDYCRHCVAELPADGSGVTPT